MKLVTMGLLIASVNLATTAEGYAPFGIALGANVYELPGGYQNAKLVSLGYAPTATDGKLDGKPVTTKEMADTYVATLLNETVEIEAASRRPDLAPKPVKQLVEERHAGGYGIVTWYYQFHDDHSTRTLQVGFDAATGRVVHVGSRLDAGAQGLPDLDAVFIAMAKGCAGSTSDGLVAHLVPAGGLFGGDQPVRETVDKLAESVHIFLAKPGNPGTLEINNANPDKPANPLGSVTAKMGGNSTGAYIEMEMRTPEPQLQEFNKQVQARVTALISERSKAGDTTKKKGQSGGF